MLQELAHHAGQVACHSDILQCLILKARDKDQNTRATALGVLVAIEPALIEDVIPIDKLLNFFDASLLSIEGITNGDSALLCLAAAAESDHSTSLMLQLFAGFLLGVSSLDDTKQHPGRQIGSGNMAKAGCADIVQILQRMDDIELATMNSHRYAAYHAAICHTIANQKLTDVLLQQALTPDQFLN